MASTASLGCDAIGEGAKVRAARCVSGRGKAKVCRVRILPEP
jgi:hypothetical protein